MGSSPCYISSQSLEEIQSLPPPLKTESQLPLISRRDLDCHQVKHLLYLNENTDLNSLFHELSKGKKTNKQKFISVVHSSSGKVPNFLLLFHDK